MDKNQEGLNKVMGAMRAPTIEEERERFVPLIKEFRKQIDGLIQRVTRTYPRNSENLIPDTFITHEPADQVRIKLTEAKMWAGKILEALGNPFPKELADKAE